MRRRIYSCKLPYIILVFEPYQMSRGGMFFVFFLNVYFIPIPKGASINLLGIMSRFYGEKIGLLGRIFHKVTWRFVEAYLYVIAFIKLFAQDVPYHIADMFGGRVEGLKFFGI